MIRITTLMLLLILVINTATSQIDAETKLTTGEPIKLKFTGVTITPPKDYHYMEDVSSFMNRDRETSISVTKNDSISYYLMVGAILKSDFSGQETKLLSKEEVPGNAPAPRRPGFIDRTAFDSDHAGDCNTRRSRTYIIIWLNTSPIY